MRTTATPGSTWARWYHEEPLATLGDVGIYNLKSLAALLGPVREVTAVSATARPERATRETVRTPSRDPDTWQLVLRHEQGALSSVLASHATVAYRRPAIELYGTAGTANLTGDDWDPHGLEVWREGAGAWELREPDDATWLWTAGLNEAVESLLTGRPPLDNPDARPSPDRGDRRRRRQRERGRTGAGAEPLRAVDGASPRAGRTRPPRSRPHSSGRGAMS